MKKAIVFIFLFFFSSVYAYGDVPDGEVSMFTDSPAIFNGSSTKYTFPEVYYKTYTMFFTSDQNITSSNSSGLFSWSNNAYGIRLGSVTGNATNEIVTIIDGGNSDIFYWNNPNIVFNADQEYFLAIVWDQLESNYRLYIDDLDYGFAIKHGTPGLIRSSQVGAYRNDVYFDGSIRDMNLYHLSRTSSEISELYNGSSTSSDSCQIQFVDYSYNVPLIPQSIQDPVQIGSSFYWDFDRTYVDFVNSEHYELTGISYSGLDIEFGSLESFLENPPQIYFRSLHDIEYFQVDGDGTPFYAFAYDSDNVIYEITNDYLNYGEYYLINQDDIKAIGLFFDKEFGGTNDINVKFGYRQINLLKSEVCYDLDGSVTSVDGINYTGDLENFSTRDTEIIDPSFYAGDSDSPLNTSLLDKVLKSQLLETLMFMLTENTLPGDDESQYLTFDLPVPILESGVFFTLQTIEFRIPYINDPYSLSQIDRNETTLKFYTFFLALTYVVIKLGFTFSLFFPIYLFTGVMDKLGVLFDARGYTQGNVLSFGFYISYMIVYTGFAVSILGYLATFGTLIYIIHSFVALPFLYVVGSFQLYGYFLSVVVTMYGTLTIGGTAFLLYRLTNKFARLN